MPRTRLNREDKGGRDGDKRNNDENAELEDISRDYEIEVENSIQMLQTEHKKDLQLIDAAFAELKSKVPAEILQMKVSDLLNVTRFGDVLVLQKKKDLDETIKGSVRKVARQETKGEGRRTRRVTSNSEPNLNCPTLFKEKPKAGGLKAMKSMSIVTKTRFGRKLQLDGESLTASPDHSRSRSASSPKVKLGPRAMMSLAKEEIAISLSQRPSRATLRTPVSRFQKSMSLNRITPKVDPKTPMSILRHAKSGETVFSMHGSPILASQIVESTANINIPTFGGILSIRPQRMNPSTMDVNWIQQINRPTLEEMKTLRDNLTKMLDKAKVKFQH